MGVPVSVNCHVQQGHMVSRRPTYVRLVIQVVLHVKAIRIIVQLVCLGFLCYQIFVMLIVL